MTTKMTKEELQAFIAEVFPQVKDDFVVEDLGPRQAKIRLVVDKRHLRPGDTVSGPSMFALADVSVYLTIMAAIGPKAMAVTTSSSLDFMRKPVPHADLIAECRLLKLGKVLAVGDVLMFSEGQEEPVARATMTYSLPPR